MIYEQAITEAAEPTDLGSSDEEDCYDRFKACELRRYPTNVLWRVLNSSTAFWIDQVAASGALFSAASMAIAAGFHLSIPWGWMSVFFCLCVVYVLGLGVLQTLFAKHRPAEWGGIRRLAYPDLDDLDLSEEAADYIHPLAREEIRRIRRNDPKAMFYVSELFYRDQVVSWVLYTQEEYSYRPIFAWPKDWL